MLLEGFKINIDVEHADSYPMVFTKIHLKYVFYGEDINPKHVKQAISLLHEKYYSVMAMF